MKLLKQRDNGGFFPVSYAFTDTIIGVLSGDAVKLYLYIKRCFAEGNEYYPSDASAVLRISGEACGSALEELELAGVAVVDGENIILTADSALRDAYAKRKEDLLTDKMRDTSYGREFKEVVTNINNEFFAGRMNARWYDFIRKCAGEYGFEPETIYILFASCKGIRTKGAASNFYNYVAKVAENWYADKVVTPEDVAEREKRTGAVREYIGFVTKKLNFSRPFTEQETSVISSWLDKGITTDMLAVYLDNTNRVRAFTVAAIDRETAKWEANGFRTADEVKQYYEDLRAAEKAKKEAGTGSGGRGKNAASADTQKHYSGERKYDEDFFAWLENRDSGAAQDGSNDSPDKQN